MQFGNVLYFLVLAGLFLFMMRFGCGAHVMGHAHAHHQGDSHSGGPWIEPEKAVDPVCGMSVAAQGAKSAVHAGHVYYFCSANGREKFEAVPASYVKQELSSPHEGHHHGC